MHLSPSFSTKLFQSIETIGPVQYSTLVDNCILGITANEDKMPQYG